MSDNENENVPLPTGLYMEETKMKKARKSKSKTKNKEVDLGAVPPHIMRIVQGVEEKRKSKKEQDLKKQQSMDSISILRKMMGSVRTKCDLDTVEDEARIDKEMTLQKLQTLEIYSNTWKLTRKEKNRGQQSKKNINGWK